MTLVPSANNTVPITGHILRGRAFIHIMNNRGPKIYPRGSACFNVPQSEKKCLVVFGDFISTFCLLLLKQDLNQSSDTPSVP